MLYQAGNGPNRSPAQDSQRAKCFEYAKGHSNIKKPNFPIKSHFFTKKSKCSKTEKETRDRNVSKVKRVPFDQMKFISEKMLYSVQRTCFIFIENSHQSHMNLGKLVENNSPKTTGRKY